MNPRPSIAALERLVAQGAPDAALVAAQEILDALDSAGGMLDGIDYGGKGAASEAIVVRFCARFAAAFGQLLSNPKLTLSSAEFGRLQSRHRWLDLIFALGGFSSSDHLLPLIGKQSDKNEWSFNAANLMQMLTVFSTESRIALNLEQCWRVQPATAATAFLSYVAARDVFSPQAFELRERILEWLPAKLDQVKLGSLMLGSISGVYMHCSYAATPHKHDIKRAMIQQMRRGCLEEGCPEMTVAPNLKAERPTIVVVTEYFGRNHSVYRTHSEALRSLRERFHVVGLVNLNAGDEPVEDFFDEIIPVAPGGFFPTIKAVAEEVLRRKPVAMFYVSSGMIARVIALSALRLAPVQIVSYGHAASTMNPMMDYFVLPEDIAGSHATYSEKVLALPKEAMPFIIPDIPQSAFAAKREAREDGVIRVAVPASVMKLNYRVFEALGRIAKEAKTKMEFHFLPLFGRGLTYLRLKKEIERYLPNAVVFAQAGRDLYFQRLARCDFFISPFPYGNTNGIVDALIFGLPGVCLDGPEIHAHIDAGLFARAGLPAELTTKTVDEYVAAIIRLIDDAEWRAYCRKIAANCDLQAAFCKGDASQFAAAIAEVVKGHANAAAKAS